MNRPKFHISEIRDLTHRNLLQYELINAVHKFKYATLNDTDEVHAFEQHLRELAAELNKAHPKCKKINIEHVRDVDGGYIITLQADGIYQKAGYPVMESPFVTIIICKILKDWKEILK